MVVKNFIETIFHRDPTVSVRIGSGSAKISEKWLQTHWFINPTENIAEAQREGLTPINFDRIQKQLVLKILKDSALLFDSPPRGTKGNYWRILEVKPGLDKKNVVTLQRTDSYGLDDKGFPPVTVSQYDAIFTGLILTSHVQGNDVNHAKIIGLSELNQLIINDKYPEDVHRLGQTSYYAKNTGVLVTRDHHPVFR